MKPRRFTSGPWQRRHPTARRIAAAMLADPALLALRSRTLRADAQARYGVGECEAKVAVSLARAASRAGDSRGTSRTER